MAAMAEYIPFKVAQPNDNCNRVTADTVDNSTIIYTTRISMCSVNAILFVRIGVSSEDIRNDGVNAPKCGTFLSPINLFCA